MILTEKYLISAIKDKEPEKISTLYLNNKNIGSISLKNHFYRVEFLSLQCNSIKDISFLKNLPNLWYLDIRMNPIESYEVISTISCFGYLGLSVEKYSEKKILSIKKINVGIMNLSIDENYKKGFMMNNQNIIKFNDEILYNHERFLTVAAAASNLLSQHRGNMSGACGRASIDLSLYKSFSTFLGINPSNGIKTMNSNSSIQSYQNNNILESPNFIRRVSYSNTIFSNDKAKQLADFFNSFNTEISSLISNPVNLLSNLNNPNFFLENVIYLKEERKKLKLLAQIYESLLLLNKNDSNVFRLSNNDQVTGNYNSEINEKIFKEVENYNNYNQKNTNTNENNTTNTTNSNIFSDINLFSIKTLNFSNLKIKDTQIQIIVLTILILYILQITGKEFSSVLIKYIFKKFLHLNLHGYEIKAFLELETEYLLGIYFDVYDNFKESYSKVANVSEIIVPLKKNTNCGNNPIISTVKAIQSSKIEPESQNMSFDNLSSNLEDIHEKNEKNQEIINLIEINSDPKTSSNSNSLDKLKYEEIFKCLEMKSLILKCNILNKTKSETSKIYSIKNDLQIRKVLINTTLIKLLDDTLKIFDEILNLIQYLNDFILFHKIDSLLLKDYTLQYRVFIEMKGLMFIHLNKKTKHNLIYNTLTDRKYTDHKYKRLGNKLFFIKNPITVENDENKMPSFLSGIDFKFNKVNKKKNIGKKVDLKKTLESTKEIYEVGCIENHGSSKMETNNYQNFQKIQNFENLQKIPNFDNLHSIHSSNYILNSSNIPNLQSTEHHSFTGFNFNSGKSSPKKNLKFFGVSMDNIDKDTIYSNIPQSEMDKLLRTTKIKYKSPIRSGSKEKLMGEKVYNQESSFKRNNSNSLNSLIKSANPGNPANANSMSSDLHYICEESTPSIMPKLPLKNYKMHISGMKPKTHSSESYFINENDINKSEYYRIPKTEKINKYNDCNSYNFLPQFNSSSNANCTLGSEFNSMVSSPKNSLLQKQSNSPRSLTDVKKKNRFLASKLNFAHLGQFRRKKDVSPSNLVIHTNSSSNMNIKSSMKTIYDFKSNYKKLVHHWNENNPHASHVDISSNKDYSVSLGGSSSEAATEINRFNNKKNINVSYSHIKAQGDNYMTAEDIFNLFSIQNKNDDLKRQITDNKYKKYTLKMRSNHFE